jgi:hypothetical protein
VDVQDEFVSKGLAGIDQRTEKFFVARRVGSILSSGSWSGPATQEGRGRREFTIFTKRCFPNGRGKKGNRF